VRRAVAGEDFEIEMEPGLLVHVRKAVPRRMVDLGPDRADPIQYAETPKEPRVFGQYAGEIHWTEDCFASMSDAEAEEFYGGPVFPAGSEEEPENPSNSAGH
jgi:hypothetical protein